MKKFELYAKPMFAGATALVLSVGLSSVAQAGGVYATNALATCPPPSDDNTKVAEINMGTALQINGDAAVNAGIVQVHQKISNSTGNYVDCNSEIVEFEYQINMDADKVSTTLTGVAYEQSPSKPSFDIQFTSNQAMNTGSGQGKIDADGENLAWLKFEVPGYRFGDFAATINLVEPSAPNADQLFAIVGHGYDTKGEFTSIFYNDNIAEGAEDFFIWGKEQSTNFDWVAILAVSGTVEEGGMGDFCGPVEGYTCVLEGNITGGYNFEVSRVVPVPAAAWLFGSGLIGLAGLARRRRA